MLGVDRAGSNALLDLKPANLGEALKIERFRAIHELVSMLQDLPAQLGAAGDHAKLDDACRS